MGTNTAITTRVGAALALLANAARHQHDLFTHEQATEAGLSTRTIRRYVAEGRWRRLHPGVYIAGSGRVDDVARACAAVLAAGPTATLSHMSAVALHGLTAWPRLGEVAAPTAESDPEPADTTPASKAAG